MIETQQAIDNLGAILDTPGIDAVYIGPSDLGFSMGLPPKLDRDEPKIMGIYETILKETKQRGLKAGIHCMAPSLRDQDDRHWASPWSPSVTTAASSSPPPPPPSKPPAANNPNPAFSSPSPSGRGLG